MQAFFFLISNKPNKSSSSFNKNKTLKIHLFFYCVSMFLKNIQACKTWHVLSLRCFLSNWKRTRLIVAEHQLNNVHLTSNRRHFGHFDVHRSSSYLFFWVFVQTRLRKLLRGKFNWTLWQFFFLRSVLIDVFISTPDGDIILTHTYNSCSYSNKHSDWSIKYMTSFYRVCEK